MTASRSLFESAYRIELSNASKKDVTIKVEESLPGDWTIEEENRPHTKESAVLAVWMIRCPPAAKPS